MNRITRFAQVGDRVIYIRATKEQGEPKYFEAINGESTGVEFKSKTQVKKYIKSRQATTA